MAAAALRQVSNPEFIMLSPVHLSALGRKPS
jgi:hypothetical protein